MSIGEHGAEAFIEALYEDDAQQLYERAPCGYLSTTPNGMIIKVNETFEALSGYRRDELVGRRRFVDLLTAGGRIYHETHYAPLLRMHGTAREIALDLVRADGSRLPLLVNAVMERNGDGHPVVIRTALFDATERRRYEQELLEQKRRAEASEARATALARTLQQTLIPPRLPRIPLLDIAARYRPAGDGSQVGGDFYDVFQARDEWIVAVGDVCGKGVEAAVVTASARYTLRAAAVQDSSPRHCLDLLNQTMCMDGGDRFCTVAVLRLTHGDGGWQLTSSSAGHPLPLLVEPDGTVTPVGTHGSLVGVFDTVDLDETHLPLRPGDALVVFTDGVPEARAPQTGATQTGATQTGSTQAGSTQAGRFYGDERLRRLLARPHTGADEIAASVLADVLKFQDGVPRDDVAIVVLRVPDEPA